MPPMRKPKPEERPLNQAFTYVYECSRCGKMPMPGDQVASRDMLRQKKVVFAEMGNFGRIKLSRVVDWLCPDCLLHDEDFLRPPYSGRRKLFQVTDPHEFLMLTDPAYAQAHLEDDSAEQDPYDDPGR